MKKRGELTSTEIITIVLSIIGFVIAITFLLVFLDLDKESRDEICSFSVLSRATAPETVNTFIPLKCQTTKYCIGKECTEFIGEPHVEDISLPVNDEEVIKKIEETSANAMFDCWSLMGEGKLDLFSGGAQTIGLNSAETACVICSRIAFNLPEERENLANQVNLPEYMRTQNIPNSGETYLEAFTDRGTNTYARTPEDIEEELEETNTIEFKTQTDELAVIFTQIKPKSYTEVLDNLGKVGGTIAGSAFLTPGVNKALLSGPGLALTGVTAAGVTIYSMSNVWKGKAVAGGYCGALTTREEAEKGCSVVQILPYEKEVINEICDHIEGGDTEAGDYEVK